jgi:hypothetical protein
MGTPPQTLERALAAFYPPNRPRVPPSHPDALLGQHRVSAWPTYRAARNDTVASETAIMADGTFACAVLNGTGGFRINLCEWCEVKCPHPKRFKRVIYCNDCECCDTHSELEP